MLSTGLIGFPVAHSLSPLIHNTAYAAMGLDWYYSLYPCPDEAAANLRISGLRERTGGLLGLNITTPCKPLAYAVADEASPAARAVQAANVLTSVPCSDGSFRLLASNYDGAGIMAALEGEGGVEWPGKRVLLCGTGPVAAVALVELLERPVASVAVASRSLGRSEQLLERLVGGAFADEVQALAYDDAAALAAAVEACDVLIDATTLGTYPDDPAVVPVGLLRRGQVVLDVVYGHGESRLIAGARTAGALAMDGSGMLVEQAALTIELWCSQLSLDVHVPREPLLAAVRAELAARDAV